MSTQIHSRLLLGSVLLIFLVFCVVFFALLFFVLCLSWYTMLNVSLDCPFLTASWFFSNDCLHRNCFQYISAVPLRFQSEMFQKILWKHAFPSTCKSKKRFVDSLHSNKYASEVESFQKHTSKQTKYQISIIYNDKLCISYKSCQRL